MQRNIKLLTISYQPCYTVFVALLKLVMVRESINDYCIFLAKSFILWNKERNHLSPRMGMNSNIRCVYFII